MCYSTVGTDDAETSALHIIVGGSPPGSEAGAAPCAAGGLRASPSSGPRPSEASLPPPIPPRLPMAIRGLFKNIRPAQSPPSLGAPGTPRPGWLPSASPCAGQAAPARAVSAFWCPARCPLPSQGPAGHRARVPRRPPCPFHVPATVPRGSSVMRVPKARKAPVLLVTGSGTERPLGGSDVCRPPHGRRTAPPPRPRSAARVGPGPGDARRRGLPLRLRGSACRVPSPPSPLLPAATPRELRGRGLAPRPRRGFPGPFGRESSISVA